MSATPPINAKGSKMFDSNEDKRIKVRQNVKDKIIAMIEEENRRALRPVETT
jgi:hypothetical protein